jgi:hypothetical protein
MEYNGRTIENNNIQKDDNGYQDKKKFGNNIRNSIIIGNFPKNRVPDRVNTNQMGNFHDSNYNNQYANQNQSSNIISYGNQQNSYPIINNKFALANQQIDIQPKPHCSKYTQPNPIKVYKPEENSKYSQKNGVNHNPQIRINLCNQKHNNNKINVNPSNINIGITTKLMNVNNPQNVLKQDNDDKTVLNKNFNQSNILKRKLKNSIKQFFEKNDFSEIFECDSVEPIFIIDSDLITDNSDYYIILAENEDKNALYFQIFYTFILTKNLKDKIFIDIKYPSSTYIEKIHSCVQKLKNNIRNDDSIVKLLEKINEIKKTPPQEVFSLSRLICVFFRIAILKYLQEHTEDEIKKEYEVNKIDDFIGYMCNLSSEFPKDEKIMKTICEIYKLGDFSDIFIQDPSEKILQNKNEKNFKILKFKENDDKRSYYAILPKNQFGKNLVQTIENDMIDHKIKELKNRLNRNKIKR